MSQKEFQRVKVIENAAGGRFPAPPLRSHPVPRFALSTRGRTRSHPSPWARLPLPCLPCPAIAALPEKPSNSRINWRACCASIAGIGAGHRVFSFLRGATGCRAALGVFFERQRQSEH